jgi:hypothetical protein
VLIAAFWGGHAEHLASIRTFAAADKKHSACGIHSPAEIYAVMSSLPVTPMIPPEQVMLFVTEVRSRSTLISLDEKGSGTGQSNSHAVESTSNGKHRSNS